MNPEHKELLKQAELQMDKTLKSFMERLRGIRVGKPSADFLKPVQVEAHGQRQPLTPNLAIVRVTDATSILVEPYDKSLLKVIQKGIVEANLDLNPVINGNAIRINLPPLTQETRKQLAKVAEKYAEEAKVSIRNIRRDSIDGLKKLEHISKDEVHTLTEQVQKITDNFTNEISKISKNKEQEILSI